MPLTLAAGPPPITVAVVSWNTQALLDRCLASLAPAHQTGLADVWVLDNASRDSSAALVSERYGWVRLIASEENLGYGQAINLIGSRTNAPWLAIANADVALRPGALEALLRAARGDPRTGIVAPRLLLPDGTTQHSVWAFPTLTATLLQNIGARLAPTRLAERLALRGAWHPDRARRVPWAEGAFLLVRRIAWDQVGGFDPGQWMSAEDLDLGWRMHRAGWATRYEPRALVDHEGSAATAQVWGDELAIHWQRCAYAWMLRRMGRGRTVAVGAINFSGSAARFLRLLASPRRRRSEELTALRRWTAVHLYAIAPRRTLSRYR